MNKPYDWDLYAVMELTNLEERLKTTLNPRSKLNKSGQTNNHGLDVQRARSLKGRTCR